MNALKRGGIDFNADKMKLETRAEGRNDKGMRKPVKFTSQTDSWLPVKPLDAFHLNRS